MDGIKVTALSLPNNIGLWMPLSSLVNQQQAVIQFQLGNVRGGYPRSAWHQRPALFKIFRYLNKR